MNTLMLSAILYHQVPDIKRQSHLWYVKVNWLGALTPTPLSLSSSWSGGGLEDKTPCEQRINKTIATLIKRTPTIIPTYSILVSVMCTERFCFSIYKMFFSFQIEKNYRAVPTKIQGGRAGR
jgi:hypothetical protein